MGKQPYRSLATLGALVGVFASAEPARAEGYVAGGALYLPLDGGTGVVAASGGYATGKGKLEARLGGIVGYGSSRYSSSAIV